MSASTHASFLPSRYSHDAWLQPFRDGIQDWLIPGVRILDIGSGRRPAIAIDERPADCQYVGLDLSAAELAAAPPGTYSEKLVGDVTKRRADLASGFDLVVSWQVLEHVKPLDVAIENIRSYLRPGGRFVGQLSGAFSFFALASRVTPRRAAAWSMHRLLGREKASVFPSYYHRCWYSALVRIGQPWENFVVHPMHGGATYLAFAPVLQRGYVFYENWVIRRQLTNLATHYLVVGTT